MEYTEVTIETGTLRGVSSPTTGVRRFLGIPYGQSTGGENRWRPPRPVAPWDGIRDALEFGPACWQTPPPPGSLYRGPDVEFSEDCLTLNVWTAPGDETLRPVMVWFHLGAFQFGSAAHPMYDGERLASRGVVLVSVNHRLGRLGFLAHAELSAESGYGGSGNYGLMDQIEALRFVQRNIAAFGGDPDNVTVCGVSAGADSVHKLRCSPLAAGLLHRAIAHSGPGVAPAANGPGNPGYASTLAAGEQAGAELFAALGIASVDEARHVPAAQLVAARLERATGEWRTDAEDASDAPGASVHRYDSAYPVVDGHVLPESEERLFREGRVADVPSLVGNAAFEQSGGRCLHTLGQYTDHLRDTFGDLAERARELYPAHSDEEAQTASRALMADEVFVSSSWNAATLHSRVCSSPVWHYRFLRTPPLSGEYTETADEGAFHGADVLYVFGTFDGYAGGWTAEDRALSDRMQRAWVAFAAKGDPTTDGVDWPSFGHTAPQSRLWDDVDDIVDLSDPERTEFWAAHRASPAFTL